MLFKDSFFSHYDLNDTGIGGVNLLHLRNSRASVTNRINLAISKRGTAAA